MPQSSSGDSQSKPAGRRIIRHPILDIESPRTVHIVYSGQTLPVREGEPIAAALMAAGIDCFRFTAKKHEGRGLFCGIGQCNDCVMIVDGVPNVRSCITPVRDGLIVDIQYGAGNVSDDHN